MAGHSHHGTSCGCDADEHQMLEGTLDFLFEKVERDRTVALNGSEGTEAKCVIKPWDQRNDETAFLESDADEQLILHIWFTGAIKLRSIIVKAGPAGHTPDKLQIFANQILDFDQAASTECTQAIEIPLTRDPVEYALRPSKFPSTQYLTLFFPSNNGEDTTRISFIGFKVSTCPSSASMKGTYSPLTHMSFVGYDQGRVFTSHSRPDYHRLRISGAPLHYFSGVMHVPTDNIDEKANPADHNKIQGMDTTAHSRIG
ncbi:hypothetical protein P7C70_g2436, partial [Phenoliferia sp. Uapishka_3]